MNPNLDFFKLVSIVNKVALQEDKPQTTEQKENNGNVSEENTTSEETQKSLSWYKKVLGFFSKAGRRFPPALRLRRAGAAADDGSAEISFLGFVYQIWQNNFKSMPRWKPKAFLRGLRGF